jgi:hypothetical protein
MHVSISLAVMLAYVSACVSLSLSIKIVKRKKLQLLGDFPRLLPGPRPGLHWGGGIIPTNPIYTCAATLATEIKRNFQFTSSYASC